MSREQIAMAAIAFQKAYAEATNIRREIARCRCTEACRPSEDDNGVPPCYLDSEADQSMMCEPCQRRVCEKRRLADAKMKVISARRKLLRITAKETASQ